VPIFNALAFRKLTVYSGDRNQAATTLKGKWRVVNPDDGKMMNDDCTAVRR
jgi:hypothetical protein